MLSSEPISRTEAGQSDGSLQPVTGRPSLGSASRPGSWPTSTSLRTALGGRDPTSADLRYSSEVQLPQPPSPIRRGPWELSDVARCLTRPHCRQFASSRHVIPAGKRKEPL